MERQVLRVDDWLESVTDEVHGLGWALYGPDWKCPAREVRSDTELDATLSDLAAG